MQSPPLRQPRSGSILTWWPCAAVSAIVWLCTFFSGEGWAILNLAAFVVAVASITAIALVRALGPRGRRWHNWLALAGAAACFAWYASCHTTDVVWAEITEPATGKRVQIHRWPAGGEEKSAVVYRDSQRVCGDWLTYRKVDGYSEQGRLDWRSEGPMTASGKQHGHWHRLFLRPIRSDDAWYWYGEEISEGEWHLRNR